MTYDIDAEYEGARVRLEFTKKPAGTLYINGLRRDQASSESANATLKLGSPVQTGYEQHEYIEAVLVYTGDSIHAELVSGGQRLAELTAAR